MRSSWLMLFVLPLLLSPAILLAQPSNSGKIEVLRS